MYNEKSDPARGRSFFALMADVRRLAVDGALTHDAPSFWLLATRLTYVSLGILKQVQDDDVGKPLFVTRLPWL